MQLLQNQQLNIFMCATKSWKNLTITGDYPDINIIASRSDNTTFVLSWKVTELLGVIGTVNFVREIFSRLESYKNCKCKDSGLKIRKRVPCELHAEFKFN